MPGLAVAPGERLVGDTPHEVLQEPVLPALRRAWVGLYAEHLLPHEAGQKRIELALCDSRELGQGLFREGLAEHRCVLEQSALLRGQPVEARCDETLQRLRDLELGNLAGQPVGAVLLDEQAAVEQHANGLDGVERDAFGARENPLAKVLRQTRHESLQQLAHRPLGERSERERRLVRSVPELGMASLELGPCEAEDEDRLLPRPLEQVGDELHERRVGPLQVLEEQRDRSLVGHPLEEEAPGAEELFLAARRPVLEPEKMEEARLDEATLLVVGHELAHGRAKLRRG